MNIAGNIISGHAKETLKNPSTWLSKKLAGVILLTTSIYAYNLSVAEAAIKFIPVPTLV
jgi:hypothetical protein